jgi:hypothetical protein
MKSCVATAALGLLFAGWIDAFPTSFTQSHLTQHIFEGGWYKNKESSSYQACSLQDTPGVGFELTGQYGYVSAGLTTESRWLTRSRTAAIKYKNGTVVDIMKVCLDLRPF